MQYLNKGGVMILTKEENYLYEHVYLKEDQEITMKLILEKLEGKGVVINRVEDFFVIEMAGRETSSEYDSETRETVNFVRKQYRVHVKLKY